MNEWEIEHWYEVDKTWNRTEIHPLELHRRDGSTVLPFEQAMEDVVILQQMYPGYHLRIRNLRTGDILPAAIL